MKIYAKSWKISQKCHIGCRSPRFKIMKNKYYLKKNVLNFGHRKWLSIKHNHELRQVWTIIYSSSSCNGQIKGPNRQITTQQKFAKMEKIH